MRKQVQPLSILLIALLLVIIALTVSFVTSKEGSEELADTSPLNEEPVIAEENETVGGTITLALPVEEYFIRNTQRTHGEYIDDGRFKGYHIGDDLEFTDKLEEDIPVFAIAAGEVLTVQEVSGYGGFIMIRHEINGTTVNANYGHVDLSSATIASGDTVTAGQQIAILGDHASEETDGERKHLHFAISESGKGSTAGYASTESGLDGWMNPVDFFSDAGIVTMRQPSTFDPTNEFGGDLFPLSFTIPADHGVEYIPQIEALNIYRLSGAGTARDRSDYLIRYFDAETFLTLSTVTIYSTEDLEIGPGYTARRYDIEKNASVADFPFQPTWRNERHIVTDFTNKSGYSRYFVVANNPENSNEDYEFFLNSMNVRD